MLPILCRMMFDTVSRAERMYGCLLDTLCQKEYFLHCLSLCFFCIYIYCCRLSESNTKFGLNAIQYANIASNPIIIIKNTENLFISFNLYEILSCLLCFFLKKLVETTIKLLSVEYNEYKDTNSYTGICKIKNRTKKQLSA